MEKHIPKRVIKRNTDKPWFTDVCKLAHQRKVKAWQVLKSFPINLTIVLIVKHAKMQLILTNKPKNDTLKLSKQI